MMDDNALLEGLDHKLQFIRDRVQGVAEGYANGLILYGEGGTSKSYTVETTLKSLGKPYMLSNSRLTGRGLFDLLRDHPDLVHVLEDVETLLADKNSLGVLRSALWGQTGEDGLQERLVFWHTARHREEVIFTGGVIMVANCPLDDIPQLRALKTRVPVIRFQPTNEEIAALMRDIARQGHRHGPDVLSPEHCLEVAEEIIARSRRLQRNLDLRLFVNACTDRVQFRNGASESHWRALLDSRVKERAVPPAAEYEPRTVRKAREQALARSLLNLGRQERLRAWEKATGKSEKALYRRLKEVGHLAHDSHFPQDRGGFWSEN
jgi:hypothetical protein